MCKSFWFFFEKKCFLVIGGLVLPLNTGVNLCCVSPHLASKPFGDLATFFPLTAPRPFRRIPARMTAADFVGRVPVNAAPDND